MNTHHKSPSARLASICSLIALLSSALPSAQAVTSFTWNTGAAGTPATGSGTWDTTLTNWTTDAGATKTTWTNGSDALFSGTASFTVTMGSGITANSLQMSTTTGVIQFGTTSNTLALDVPTISLASAGNIDMFANLSGNHDLNLSAVASGRLNLKSANTYTGDTRVTGTAVLTLGNTTGSPSDILPTGTTLYMDKGTQLQMFSGGTTQKIAGLVGTGNGTGATPIVNNRVGAGLTYGLTIETKASTTTSFDGTLKSNSTDILNLTIAGSGTQALTGTLSFLGTVTVSSGTLSLGSSLTGANSVTVSGGTLTNSANVTLGTGTVILNSGAINIRGTGTVGTLTLATNQNFTSGIGTLNFDLLGASSFDQIIASGSGTGAFNLTGTTLALSGSFASVVGTYQLFSGFGGTNNVSDINITGLGSGLAGSLDTTGLLTIATAIPEPSTYAMLTGATVLGFVAYRRRSIRR